MQSEIILGLIFHSKIIIAFSKIKDNSHLKQDRGLSKLRFIIIALLKAFRYSAEDNCPTERVYSSLP